MKHCPTPPRLNRSARTGARPALPGTAGLAALALLTLVACGGYDGDDDGPQDFRQRNELNQSSGSGEDGIAEFSTTVYPLVRAYCEDCHGGAGPGTPQIAHPDVSTAYYAILSAQKVSFADPINSRLVQRLASDQHYCWTNCMVAGAVMNEAIQIWIDLMGYASTSETIDETIASNRIVYNDEIEVEAGERYEGALIAFWDFKEDGGPVALDKSNVPPAMDLTLTPVDDEPLSISWLESYGLSFQSGVAKATDDASRKLYDRIASPNTGSQAYSMEAWITNANTGQEGPARIVTYSRNSSQRNFTLGQQLYTYDFRNRNIDPEINGNGTPSLQTYDVDEDAQATLQHVIITYDQLRGRRIYVNGIFTDDVDEGDAERLWNWNPDYEFGLGNEPNGDRQWMGKIQLVAIYDRVLTQAQISKNYDAGVGKKVILRFDIGDWTGSDTYVDFVVSVFDDYSYLFCAPTLTTNSPNGFRLKGIRIQVNDVIPATGQAFQTLESAIFTPEQKLSQQCSVIAQDQGIDSDEFSLVFEAIDQVQHFDDITYPTPNISIIDTEERPLEGFRTFAQINDTMATITGVDPLGDNVDTTYLGLRRQLPSSDDLRSYVSSHQVGVSKLSLEYCDSLVESTQLREDFFGTAFEFDSPVYIAFSDSTKRDQIIASLVTGILGTDIDNQPAYAEVQPVLATLIDGLTAGCDPTNCDVVRTRTTVKAACSAVMSSAGMSVY